ncbi:glutathione S-transferase family protein [Oceaniovalibus sp. ACAM 378]|uniref:glutathione S-transferase family protein n=1 Tax=Oceaniovalibus sp. ACAM 378 TaxID=2599923 RepID=UPI0011D34C95|nr:glutathione S-transferase family protein [Oceaniovalibus sp. ACAM 378]TYB86776.1 glutathione S-transferase family protein [Oceaniovalibus sp. ACAM 378]
MLELYAHPFSSYSQKVLTALYEYHLDFDFRMLSPDQPANMAALAAVWPFRKFPVLIDNGTPLREATIIVEHLTLHHAAGAPLIPADATAALDVRFMDRFFDIYIATPQQRIIYNALRPEGQRDPLGDDEARAGLDTAYAWLDGRMAGLEWACGDFSLADCSAAPQLFYADWTHPIGDRFPNVTAYRQRLLARPSFARCVEEARPHRPLFPLGAPDRD